MKKLLFLLFTIHYSLFTIHCFAQFDFIGRKINPNQPKPIPSSLVKSGNTIPSLDFKFDSIRPLNELKTGYGELFPWLSSDGNRIYYSEGNNPTRIYVAEKKIGQYKFSNPHPLSINGDTSNDDYCSGLTIDELNIYFVQGRGGTFYLCHSRRYSINHDFLTPVKVKLNGIGNTIYTMVGPSFTQDSSQLYLGIQSNGISKPMHNICIFNKTAVDEYTYSDTLQVDDTNGDGTLTSDDLNYFLSIGNGNGKSLVRLYLFKRDSINGKFTKLYYINNPYINDTNYLSITTPYFSISNNILAFSKCDSGYVSSNFELYFAYNFKQFDNIKENNNISNYIKIFPNPTDNYVELLSTKLQYLFDYYLFNPTGQTVKSGTFINNIKLDLSSFNKGIYILTIYNKNTNQKAYYKIMKL